MMPRIVILFTKNLAVLVSTSVYAPDNRVMCRYSDVFFFFQAEDGIRDYKVTGVQTCALPICRGEEDRLGFRFPRQICKGCDGHARARHYRDMTTRHHAGRPQRLDRVERLVRDRKSTRLNSSHLVISYAVFCLKKKKRNTSRIALSQKLHSTSRYTSRTATL